MEERIELNAFLNQLIAILNRKFEVLEDEIRNLRRDVDTMKQSQSRDDEPLKALDSKVRNLEFSVNSLRSKSQVDRSMLKVLESEKL